MKYKELDTLKPAELAKKEEETKLELIKQHAQAANGTTPKSPGQIGQLKKILARINTIKHNKQTNPQTKEVQEQDAGN